MNEHAEPVFDEPRGIALSEFSHNGFLFCLYAQFLRILWIHYRIYSCKLQAAFYEESGNCYEENHRLGFFL